MKNDLFVLSVGLNQMLKLIMIQSMLAYLLIGYDLVFEFLLILVALSEPLLTEL